MKKLFCLFLMYCSAMFMRWAGKLDHEQADEIMNMTLKKFNARLK